MRNIYQLRLSKEPPQLAVIAPLNICFLETYPLTEFIYEYASTSNQSNTNTTGVTSGAGTTYPSGAPKFIPDTQESSCSSTFSFLCSVLQIFVLFSIFCWLLCCLFLDLRILNPLWYLQTLFVAAFQNNNKSAFSYATFICSLCLKITFVLDYTLVIIT